MDGNGKQDDFEGRQSFPDLSRRDFLRLAGLMTGAGLAPAALIGCGPQSTTKPTTGATPTTLPTVANPGERIPEIQFWIQNTYPWFADAARKIALDGEKVGLRYKINNVSSSAWLNSYYNHLFQDLLGQEMQSRDYRDADPTEHLVVRLHSREAEPPKRNIGEYKNPEVDKLAEEVETQLDPQKRLEAAWKIQDIVAKDYYWWGAATGPNAITAYNSADWEDVTSTAGSSVGGTNYIWNWMSVKPKTGRKRAVYGVASLDVLSVSNPYGPGGVRGTNQLYWDKMVALSPGLKLTPWIATAWKMVDNVTWDLTIREGLKFHDGRPATTEDVAFSFNYIVKWKPSFYSVVSGTITQATAVDQRTVRLKTKLPAANMTTDLLIRTPLVPKHIWENLVENQNVKDPSAAKMDPSMIIGTGPFKFGHFIPDVELLVTANKDHWNAPKFEELLHIIVPNLDSMLGKLEAKEIDFESEFLTPTQANRLKEAKHISVDETPKSLNSMIYTFFSHLPWHDPVFRRGWHRTVDRDYIVKVIWEGAGKALPFNTMLGERHPFHNPNIKERFNYDLDEARKIWSEGGYSWDKEGRLLYPSSDNAAYKKRLETGLA